MSSNRLTANHPRFHEIPCPTQKAAIKRGLLIADTEGNVSKENGHSFVRAMNVDGLAKTGLVVFGSKAAPSDVHEGGWNVFKLRDSTLKHTGNTGILDPSQPGGYHKARLEALLSLSTDRKNITLKNLSAGNAIRTGEDNSDTRATILGMAELGAVLRSIGKDGSLTLDEVRNFFANAEFPAHFEPNSPDTYGTPTMLWTVIKMALQKVWQRMTGSLEASKSGYEAALSKPQSHAANQALKGAEGGCPFGFDKMGGGQPPAANKPSDEARS